MFRGQSENSTLLPQINFHSRFHFQLMRELGVHASAGRRQRL